MNALLRKLLYVDLGLPSGKLWARRNRRRHLPHPEALQRYGDVMPSIEDWRELSQYCTRKWCPARGGYLLKGPNGKKMFLPANGFYDHTRKAIVHRDMGYYWSNTTYNTGAGHAVYFYSFGEDGVRIFINRPGDGFSIRTIAPTK